jgi:hypothetical protein
VRGGEIAERRGYHWRLHVRKRRAMDDQSLSLREKKKMNTRYSKRILFICILITNS